MSNVDSKIILKQIEINKNHIENFVLETEEGTKKFKNKFHKKAVEDRNLYVNGQIELFKDYQAQLVNEMNKRLEILMPTDMTSQYENDKKNLDQLLELVILNANVSSNFKLGLDYIIYDINENTSLENINNLLNRFIERFKELGIILTIDDFSYSMFTEQYMDAFFKNSSLDVMKEVFEKIYFRCPNLVLHIKMNLFNILSNYNNQLEQYVEDIKEKKFLKYKVNEDNVIDVYAKTRVELGTKIAEDPYYNTSMFINGEKKISDYLEESATRLKNYNLFVVDNDYNNLNDIEKTNYNSAIMGLYLTLNELKKYYNYEFILNDLLNRYKNKDTVKGEYSSIKKQIEKEEKKRLGIYKDYLKANGVGLFARKNDDKIKESMLKMNEQIRTLNSLYDSFKDLEITNQLSQLSESASIYDLFCSALTSFSFLSNCFLKEEEFMNNSLEENVLEFVKFIYNPNNSILRKINVFAEYDIVSVVAEKYKLLNLNINSEMIDKDNIDSTLDSVKFINLIQNIDSSNISLHDILILHQMRDIIKDYNDKNVDDMNN